MCPRTFLGKHLKTQVRRVPNRAGTHGDTYRIRGAPNVSPVGGSLIRETPPGTWARDRQPAVPAAVADVIAELAAFRIAFIQRAADALRESE